MSETSDTKEQVGKKIQQDKKPVEADRLSDEALDKVAGGMTKPPPKKM